MKRFTSSLTMLLVLCSLLVALLGINMAVASETIYIRSDGSVDGTNDIERVGDVYTFTNNIYDEIVVNRSNIIIDGSGYTLQGSWIGSGFYLCDRNNVTIQNTNIKRFEIGVNCNSSSYNTISGNSITENILYGVYLNFSFFNTVSANNITNNDDGILLEDSSNNAVSGNNITNNSGDGIHLYWQSVNNIVSRNNIANNFFGVELEDSSDNSISGNNVTNIERGVSLSWSSFNTVSGNDITNNKEGVWFSASSNNTVSGNNITNNRNGVHLVFSSSYNTLSFNNMTNNKEVGVWFSASSNNTVTGNTIGNSSYGVYLPTSSDNKIYHNNIMNNTQQVRFSDPSSANVWDDSYPSGGNHWSNYTDVDLFGGAYQNVTGSDGIGDTLHILDANNTDNYPLMGMFSSFNAYPGYYVNVISNSTIEDFQFQHTETNSTITIHVSNASSTQSFGFCRLSLPKGLIFPPYTVRIDNGLTEVLNFTDTLYDNSTHRWTYFAYEHSTRKVEIQGFSPPIISILSPENKTYGVKDVPLILTVNEPTSWMGYSLDGQTNATVVGNTTIPGLSEGAHAVIVYANDTAGYMGFSDMVDFSVDTVPPAIQILSPENTTYAASSVSLNFTVDEATSWIGYSLDGQMNVTTDGNTTLSELSIGMHGLAVYANDTVGNMGFSDIVYFTILDTTPPSISIVSPENKTYANTDIPLTFTIDESVSWMAYSLDGQANVTITGNTTLTELSEGPHSLIIYADDTSGNTAASERIYFTIEIEQAEPFPQWIVTAIGIVVVVGAAGVVLLVYFKRSKRVQKRT